MELQIQQESDSLDADWGKCVETNPKCHPDLM